MSKQTFIIGDTLEILWLDYDRNFKILYTIIKIDSFILRNVRRDFTE